MSRYYNKDTLKENLSLEQIYDLLEAWGGEPEYIEGGIVSQTICHNLPGEGSRKLYYYDNTKLAHCYTHCGSFDVFELAIKVHKIQFNENWELYDAMDYIASYFGIAGEDQEDSNNPKLADWDLFKLHKPIETRQMSQVTLKEYDPIILTRFSYPRIMDWENEGIASEICRANLIGYYPGGEQITIPHFDINNRLIGIRGRALSDDIAERYGKYRPLMVNRQLYNHPLSMNLYNLNNSKEAISRMKVAIVFEGEKSCLQYQSFYGHDNDISVAGCGSSVSSYQMYLLWQLGVRELIVAFDRQFQEIGDEEFQRLKRKLIYLHNKYNRIMNITAIFDKGMLTPYKASPTDSGPEIFEQLLQERIVPVE